LTTSAYLYIIFSVNDGLLSTVYKGPPNPLIYSALSAYGRRRGGELPGPWFVAALEPLKQTPAATRQALFRMESGGELVARKKGRIKQYRLSAYGLAAIEVGAEKLLTPPAKEWDGQWTLVQYRFGSDERMARDAVHRLLELEGFAALGRGLYLHPRDRIERVQRILEGVDVRDQVVFFRARRISREKKDKEFVKRLWDLTDLDKRYRKFVRSFEKLSRRPSKSWTDQEAFAWRFAVVMSYLPVAWADPELPPVMLPAKWAGYRARDIAKRLYESLLPGTLAYGDAVMERIRKE